MDFLLLPLVLNAKDKTAGKGTLAGLFLEGGTENLNESLN